MRNYTKAVVKIFFVDEVASSNDYYMEMMSK